MQADVVAGILMGGGGLVTAGITSINNWRDRRYRKEKHSSDIEIDDETKKHIATDAAKINADERIETERWWKEQFDAVKSEVKDQNERWRKAKKRWKVHEAWDKQMAHAARERGDDVPDPPPLDPDEDWEDD